MAPLGPASLSCPFSAATTSSFDSLGNMSHLQCRKLSAKAGLYHGINSTNSTG